MVISGDKWKGRLQTIESKVWNKEDKTDNGSDNIKAHLHVWPQYFAPRSSDNGRSSPKKWESPFKVNQWLA